MAVRFEIIYVDGQENNNLRFVNFRTRSKKKNFHKDY